MEVGSGHTVNKPDLTSSSMDCTTKIPVNDGEMKLRRKMMQFKMDTISTLPDFFENVNC